MCWGVVVVGRLCGRPPDGARRNRRAGLQQCRSFVEMCIVSCFSASPCHTSMCMWAVDCNLMMMSFICSCRNKKEEQSSIYTLRKVHTILGCLEGLSLMI